MVMILYAIRWTFKTHFLFKCRFHTFSSLLLGFFFESVFLELKSMVVPLLKFPHLFEFHLFTLLRPVSRTAATKTLII
jgi:hypothetical protein